MLAELGNYSGVLAANWLVELLTKPTASNEIAHAVLIVGLISAVGLIIGTIRIVGISLGVAGVLFAGLAFGHFGIEIDGNIREFVRDFGLILFVYTIGMQVGPGFIASLRKQGLSLSLMGAAIVILGVITTLIIYYTCMDRGQFAAAVGLLTGATTNTPSLAATQQTLRENASVGANILMQPGIAYAVAYPFGIIGTILAMLAIRWIFRIDMHKEADLLLRTQHRGGEKLKIINFEVKNPNLNGLTLSQIPMLDTSGIVISRIMKGGKPLIAKPDTTVNLGDILLAVGPAAALDQFKIIVGEESKVDLMAVPSSIATKRILVTKAAAVGKTIAELDLTARFGVRVTRVHRTEIELPVTPDLRLQFADNLAVVGDPDNIKQVSAEFGDSARQLNHPQIIPVFVGIALGVILGSAPLRFPGVPLPVKLGLAGGPLLVAIILSRLGRIGSLVWYMPISANFMMRELGIALFLACVGLRSGGSFVTTLVEGDGLRWLGYGAIITFVPLFIVGLFARVIYKLNYMHLCGLLAGSMTDHPALAFAGQLTASEAPSVSYATVYPLVMILRVVFAQALILYFIR